MKRAHKYGASAGSKLTDKEAVLVGSELERIEATNGCLKPATVVDVSRPATAPLHRYFNWDDSKAAELYRQDQARSLIRSVVLVRVGSEEVPPVRAFVNVTCAKGESRFEGSGYISSVRAMRETDYREQVLSAARSELASFRVRYQHLQELASVLRAIEELVPLAA